MKVRKALEFVAMTIVFCVLLVATALPGVIEGIISFVIGTSKN